MNQGNFRSLAGRRVLIVEDHRIIAFSERDMLVEMGATVIGPALTLQSGHDLALSATIDVAVLDLWMQGEQSYAVGDVLQRRGIPFLLTSAADSSEPRNFRAVPRIMKPFLSRELADALISAMEHRPGIA